LPGIVIALCAVWPPIVLNLSALAVAGLQVLPWPLRIAAMLGACILVFDIAARLRDFRRVSVNLRRDPSLLAQHVGRYKRSWCQRTVLHWAAFAALGEAGRDFVRRQFGAMGYRWFHVFPDKTFSRECPFLRVSFWRSTIGGTPEVRVESARAPAE
jgi:hypothetical protein